MFTCLQRDVREPLDWLYCRFTKLFPINPQPKCQDRADWQREEKASVGICWTGVWQWWLHIAMRTNLLWSTASIPPDCVIHLPRDPPEETAPSQSSSKRLGMSCTATDGIYVIRRALPRPCLSFLGEMWPATVTNPHEMGGETEGGRKGGGGGRKDVICACWWCAFAVCQQSTAVQIYAHLCFCCSKCVPQGGRDYGNGGKRNTAKHLPLSERKKKKSATKVRWRTCRRRCPFLLSCGLNIQTSYSDCHNKW